MEASAAPANASTDLGLRLNLAMVWALIRRATNELLRVPGAAIPGVLAPTIFFLGLTAVFAELNLLEGFDAPNYQSFLIPISMLQGAGFTGAATGVNLARDIEQGWFDRLYSSPAPRWVLLTGMVGSAALRSLIPATVLVIVGLAIGVEWPGIFGLLLAYLLVMGVAVVAGCWGTMLALKFKTQAAAPLMQAGMLVAILTTTAYAPQELLTGWIEVVAPINPLTHVVEAVRQGFVGEGLSWSETWPGLISLAGLIAVLAALALRGMRRIGE